MKDIGKMLELHPKAQNAIASSWRSLARFLPKTLPISDMPKLEKTSYSVVAELDLNKFSPTDIDHLQLYWLVVRALRLCDMRSVQLNPTSN
jgi:CRISPR-associated endonuclease/helicase Cas3